MNTDFTAKTEYFKNELAARLTPRRFKHCLCVADEAVRLAELYGYADTEKAYFAGLLHDITKDASAEYHLGIIEKYGYPATELELSQKKLWHAKTGALVLEREYGIEDAELLSAVSYHTTAKEKMSPLEELLYLADFTSADRDYEGIEEIRRAVSTDKTEALKIALSFTVEELASKRKPIHPDTIGAYNEIMIKE